MKKEPVETGSQITHIVALFLLVAVRRHALLATVLLAFWHVALAFWHVALVFRHVALVFRHVAAVATLLIALAGRGWSVIAILIAPAFGV